MHFERNKSETRAQTFFLKGKKTHLKFAHLPSNEFWARKSHKTLYDFKWAFFAFQTFLQLNGKGWQMGK
jgi:hypothetical protein